MKKLFTLGALLSLMLFSGSKAEAHYDMYDENHGHVCTAETGLNMRTQFKYGSEIIAEIGKGQKVQVIGNFYNWETEETWYLIRKDGKQGWVSGNYICF